MVEIECPFCEEACRMEAAAFTSGAPLFRCEGCRVEVELADAAVVACALAA